MFAAWPCVSTLSGFNRTLTDQININGSRVTSKPLGLQLSRKFHSPTCETRDFGRRSSKHPDEKSKDSTPRQLFQEVLAETNQLKVALDRNNGKIDQLNTNIQSVLQHLSKLQVNPIQETPHYSNMHQQQTPTTLKPMGWGTKRSRQNDEDDEDDLPRQRKKSKTSHESQHDFFWYPSEPEGDLGG